MPGQKKAPWEYSTNKNTVRSRVRKSRLTEYQREVEQAKASDSKAVSRAWKIRADTDTYKMATAKDKQMILEKVEREVMERRRHRGLDSDTKISRFMQRHNDPAMGSAVNSPSAALASPAATDPATDPAPEIPMDVAQNTVSSSFSSLLNYEAPHPFTYRHDEYENQQLSNRLSPSPSFHVDKTEGDNHLLSHSQMLRGFGDFSGPPISSNTIQHGLVTGNVVNSSNQAELNASRDQNQIHHLKSQVDALTCDLIIARSTITALEARMKKMEARMTADDDDANSPRRLARRVKSIVDALIEVAHQLDRSESVESDQTSD